MSYNTGRYALNDIRKFVKGRRVVPADAPMIDIASHDKNRCRGSDLPPTSYPYPLPQASPCHRKFSESLLSRAVRRRVEGQRAAGAGGGEGGEGEGRGTRGTGDKQTGRLEG